MSKKIVREEAKEIGESINKKDDIKFYNISADLSKFNGDFDQMIQGLKKAVANDPTNKDLLNAVKNFSIMSEELKNITNNFNNNIHEVISSPIKNLSERLEKDTPLGKLQTFVSTQTEKAKEALKNTIGENKILKAAWGVVLAVCNVIKVTINGVLNSAMAHGELAMSVKELNVAVSNSFQKTQSNSRAI